MPSARPAPARPSGGLLIWTNMALESAARARLEAGVAAAGHRLVTAARTSASVLAEAEPDEALARADVAWGQPGAADCLRSRTLRWVGLSTAGYTRFDDETTRESFAAQGRLLTNASSVFAEPCAQHALAMMLALARALPASVAEQRGERRWMFFERRAESRLLNGQTLLLLSYGAIARRLVELLAPFGLRIYVLRRRAYSEPGVHVISEERLTAVLAEADHVVNVLPENDHTRRYVNARRLAAMKPGAFFYNLGRGATVDEHALVDALASGRLGGAYLDVFDTEPLPPAHPFWTAPNCWITPHTAGGRRDQDDALVDLFLHNLRAFAAGDLPALRDRVWG